MGGMGYEAISRWRYLAKFVPFVSSGGMVELLRQLVGGEAAKSVEGKAGTGAVPFLGQEDPACTPT